VRCFECWQTSVPMSVHFLNQDKLCSDFKGALGHVAMTAFCVVSEHGSAQGKGQCTRNAQTHREVAAQDLSNDESIGYIPAGCRGG